MRRLIPFVLLLLATAARAQDADPLAQYVWVARPVVVFADTPNDPRFIRQMEMFKANEAALNERNIVVLGDTDPAANGPLRQKLHPLGFMLVVIAKDGSIIFRKASPWSVRAISNAIDKTPMRIDEIDAKLGK